MKTLKDIFTTRVDPNDKGAAAIIVGISLLMLMGFAALAVDAGIGYNDRRGTQNAADLAALAAAWEDCNPKSSTSPNPQQAARNTAADNDYDPTAGNVTVVVNDLGDGDWQVDIQTVNDSTFGGATPYAGDSMTVLSSAVASCEEIPFLGGYALFAGGPSTCNGGVELDLSGSSKIVNGGIHSNGEVKITGSTTAINGDVTYVENSNYTPSTQVFEEKDYPIDVTIEQYRPTGSRALKYDDPDPNLTEYHYFAGDIDSSSLVPFYATQSGSSLVINKSGVYYTTGDVKITKDVTMAPGVKVTWVSEGKMSFSGKTDLTGFDPVDGGPNDPGIALFSNHLSPSNGGPSCTANAISISSSGVNWTGVIFAPYGSVNPSFSSATTLNGSIFAYTLNVSGSDFDISWHDNPDGDPNFAVDLLK